MWILDLVSTHPFNRWGNQGFKNLRNNTCLNRDLILAICFLSLCPTAAIKNKTDSFRPENSANAEAVILMERISYPCALQEAAEGEAAFERNEGGFSDASRCTNKTVTCCWTAPVLKAGKGRERRAWQQRLGFPHERTVCWFPKWLIVLLYNCQQVGRIPVSRRLL